MADPGQHSPQARAAARCTLHNGGVATQRFLSAADAAELLGVEPRDVIELVRAGSLPGIRVAGGWRIEESALQAWIDEQYEVERRAALWHESQDASVQDLFGDRR